MAERSETAARGPGVWMLAVAQTLSYACLYYIFAALILAWEADLGWDRRLLALGPGIAIGIAAALAPLMGRAVDLGRGPEVMLAGAILGAVSLAGLAVGQSEGHYLVAWAGIGLAQAASLYETCFAFLIRRLTFAARAAIVRVTLVAGFASTLAFPAGALLSDMIGWRGAVWVAAFTMAALVLPLVWWGTEILRRDGEPPMQRTSDKGTWVQALRTGRFWMLAAIFSLIALNHWMLVNFAVPIFTERGAPQRLAVTAASVIGPAQVAGRLVLMRYEARLGTMAAAQLTFLGMGVGIGCLWLAGLAPQAIFAFAVVQGGAIGVMTILRPVLIADVMGPAGYGAIAGTIQIPALLAGAVAPVLGAMVLSAGGVPAMIVLALALILVSLALALRLAG